MAIGDRYPHLFIPQPAPIKFASGPGRGDINTKKRDRKKHADHLKEALISARQYDQSQIAAIERKRNGTYLEFSGEPNFDLALNSLESRSKGIKLLNVHASQLEDGEEAVHATVYIPRGEEEYFENKATQYESTDNPPKLDGSQTPKNAALVESISNVVSASLDNSFWRDDLNSIPEEEEEWVEVWLSSEIVHTTRVFRALCRRHSILVLEDQLIFPDRTVTLILANRAKLELLLKTSDHIAEFRAAKTVSTLFIQEANSEQSNWVADLLSRTSFEDSSDVSVLILDHGVNSGHELLKPLIDEEECFTIEDSWGSFDHKGHGTLMAGTVGYGDLTHKLDSTGNFVINYRIESCKIFPPPPEENPRNLWGDVTKKGIARAEKSNPKRKRIICLAVTSQDQLARGRPSSWSAQLDELAAGARDNQKRLIVISAGNTVHEDWIDFPVSNMSREIHDPAQAWNALTVGAYTEKTTITHPDFQQYSAIASSGDISPYTTTSVLWSRNRWPIKPEVLFEGGNVSKKNDGSGVFDIDDLQLLSTNFDPTKSQFAPFFATSAASALAAKMAATIQVQYPNIWPETVRGLIVHSARWTDTQIQNHLHQKKRKGDYVDLMRKCGYGVPNLTDALSCASDSLTLISQSEIQPFRKSGSNYLPREMHLYELPWPKEQLKSLDGIIVQMRVTLSYFIEPSPASIGWENRYRYQSHALAFELNSPGESKEVFLKRTNKIFRKDQKADTSSPSAYWKIGDARNRGSIHSDIWEGKAIELASSNLLGIIPKIGWWRDRSYLGKAESSSRYSLIVSIKTRETDIDIYTPVAAKVGIPTPIEIKIG